MLYPPKSNALMITTVSIGYSFLNDKQILRSLLVDYLMMSKYNVEKWLSKFAVITVAYISAMKFKVFFLPSKVIHELTAPYSSESYNIMDHINQTINTIERSMTISAPGFPCGWAEAIKLAAYLMNMIPVKHLLSSPTLFEHFHFKKPIISYLKLFRSKLYVHIG
jgi:hypothetical protein